MYQIISFFIYKFSSIYVKEVEIVKESEEFLKPNIVETYNPDRTKLTIFSVNQIDTKLNTKHNINDTIYSLNEKKIITFLSNTDKVKAKYIALAVGLSLSTVKGILYKLVRDGVVSTEGTIKDKKYFIIIK